MKKLLSLTLAALMAVSMLSGCSNGSDNSSTAQNSGEEPTGTITLKVAHNMDFVTIPDAVLAAGERLNEKYAAEGKDLKIEFETDYARIDWGEYSNNLIFAQKNGEGPDIFSVSDLSSLVEAGMMLDISDLMTDDFVEGIYTPYIVDGKAYAMPFDLPVRVIYYNKSALKEIGWTDEQIEALPTQMANGEFTWEQFLDLCKEVQDKGAATWGLTHRPGAGSDFLDVFQTLGGEYYNDEGKLVFDSEGLQRFFQEIYDNANTTKITPQNLTQTTWDTINTMVGDGTAFAYYGPLYSATYVAGAVDKTPEQFAEDVGFAVFPVSEYNDTPFCIAAPQGMGINATTQYPEICKDLFRELYSGDSIDQLAHHADTIFTLSSVKAANEMEDIKTNPILEKVGYMADLSVTPPNVDGLNTYTNELYKQIQLLELGQTTPEQAVADMKTQIEINLDADLVEYK